MRETRPSGSVEGVMSNRDPYSDLSLLLQGSGAKLIRVLSFVLPLRISLYADKTSIFFSH